MRILMLGAATAALFSAMPAAAQVYVGVRGGATLDQSSTNQGQTTATIPATTDFGAIPAGTSLGWETDFETGYDVSGQIGYRFADGLRVEIEGGYSDSKVDSHRNLAVGGAVIDAVDVAVLTRGAPAATNPTVGAVLSTDPGSVKTIYGFGNVFYDINSQGRFQPYFGLGLGAVRVDVDYSPSGVAVVNDKQTRFAYQLMGGATYKLSDNFEVFAQYTWRATPDRAETDVSLLPARLGVESRQSIVGGGVRVAFGGGN
ncbi:outer membrane protein [Sphingomonas sp. CJ99]